MRATCDLVLTNAIVLTMDPRFTLHRSSAVAITGDSITAVGPDALTYEATETINCHGRVMMPGLVNTHTHVPMSLMRGLADDLRLDVWRSEEHTSELQSLAYLVCRLLLEKKKKSGTCSVCARTAGAGT